VDHHEVLLLKRPEWHDVLRSVYVKRFLYSVSSSDLYLPLRILAKVV